MPPVTSGRHALRAPPRRDTTVPVLAAFAVAIAPMLVTAACHSASSSANPAVPDATPASASSGLPENSASKSTSSSSGSDPWSALLTELPALASHERYPAVSLPLWMTTSKPESLWIDSEVGCVPLEGMTRDGGELHGALEICRRDLQPGQATCTRDVRIGSSLVIDNGLFCQARRGDDGVGMGSGSTERRFRVQLIASDENRAQYAMTWKIQLVPDEVVLVEQPCAAGSAERARAAHREAHPEASAEEMTVELWERHGLRDDHRACLISRGVRPALEPADPRHRRGDRGLGVKREVQSEPADCAEPCPADADTARMRRDNPILSRHRLVEPDAPRYRVYRTRQACESDIDDDPLPLDPDESCFGDWLHDLEKN